MIVIVFDELYVYNEHIHGWLPLQLTEYEFSYTARGRNAFLISIATVLFSEYLFLTLNICLSMSLPRGVLSPFWRWMFNEFGKNTIIRFLFCLFVCCRVTDVSQASVLFSVIFHSKRSNERTLSEAQRGILISSAHQKTNCLHLFCAHVRSLDNVLLCRWKFNLLGSSFGSRQRKEIDELLSLNRSQKVRRHLTTWDPQKCGIRMTNRGH